MSVYTSARASLVAAALTVAVCSGASATPPGHRQLGARFQILSRGRSITVEIRLKPIASFDSARVEAGSGVGSLTPPCSFTNLVRGGSYVCRVNVTHASGQPSLTLNVVGERQVDPSKPRMFEVTHITIANPQFIAPAQKGSARPTPGLELKPAASGPQGG